MREAFIDFRLVEIKPGSLRSATRHARDACKKKPGRYGRDDRTALKVTPGGPRAGPTMATEETEGIGAYGERFVMAKDEGVCESFTGWSRGSKAGVICLAGRGRIGRLCEGG